MSSMPVIPGIPCSEPGCPSPVVGFAIETQDNTISGWSVCRSHYKRWRERTYAAKNAAAIAAHMAEAHKARRALVDALISETLGTVCAHCGGTDRLEVDHFDPATKAFKFSVAISHSPEEWRNELAKCQLLCRRCHMDKHSIYRMPDGTVQSISDSSRRSLVANGIWIGWSIATPSPARLARRAREAHWVQLRKHKEEA